MSRRLIRASGEVVLLDRPHSITEIRKLIGAEGLDTVNLRRDGLVMVLDDLGHPKQLPINAEATELYHSVCKPGTTFPIRGDVVVVPDADFA